METKCLYTYTTDCFPGQQKQLAANKNKNIQLKMYNRTMITQLGMCKVKIEHNTKQKMCKRCEPHIVVVSVKCCYAGEPGSIPGKGWKHWAVFP